MRSYAQTQQFCSQPSTLLLYRRLVSHLLLLLIQRLRGRMCVELSTLPLSRSAAPVLVLTRLWFSIRYELAVQGMESASWHTCLQFPTSASFAELFLPAVGLLPSILPTPLKRVFARLNQVVLWCGSTCADHLTSVLSASWTLTTSFWLKITYSDISLRTWSCGFNPRVAMDTAFQQLFGSSALPSPAQAREEGNNKVRVVAAGKDAAATAEHALKMAVVIEQQLRVTQAAAFRSMPLPVTSEYYKYLQHAYAQYSSQTKGNKGHGLGPPDTFNAAALVLVASQTASPEDKAKFDEYLNSCKPGTKAAKMAVLLCRCEKMYGNTHKRLLLRLRDRVLEDLLVKHIESAGVEEFHGPRPAGYLATTAQTLLDSRK